MVGKRPDGLFGFISYIRQAALGKALIPFQRVQQAMECIYSQHNWNPNQRKWLYRLAKQLTHEVIIDRDTINQLPAMEGGAKRLDKTLDNQWDTVLMALNDGLWEQPEQK